MFRCKNFNFIVISFSIIVLRLRFVLYKFFLIFLHNDWERVYRLVSYRISFRSFVRVFCVPHRTINFRTSEFRSDESEFDVEGVTDRCSGPCSMNCRDPETKE